VADAPQDHFSTVASAYRAFRPGYPPELFDWLAGLASRHDAALDAGCGSGQASVALAAHFASVHAVDASRSQIEKAEPHPRVTYLVAPAEATGLPGRSVDLTISAQALHWFDTGRFYAELRRISRPGSVFAAFTYGLARVNEEVDRVVDALYWDTLRGFWPPERAHVEAQYRSLPFPLPEITPPPFAMEDAWPLERFLGYLTTWSGVKEHRERTGGDALVGVAPALRRAWGAPDRPRRVVWPLALRVGRVEPDASG
jgi:SAM-dependent methyltransferase